MTSMTESGTESSERFIARTRELIDNAQSVIDSADSSGYDVTESVEEQLKYQVTELIQNGAVKTDIDVEDELSDEDYDDESESETDEDYDDESETDETDEESKPMIKKTAKKSTRK